MRLIQVGRNISVTKKGQNYDGVLGIGGRTLMFQLRLPRPILEMGNLKRDMSDAEVIEAYGARRE